MNRFVDRGILLLVFIFFVFPSEGKSADSVLTFQKTKSILLRNNLSLLAAYYDLDIAKAVTVQSKLWNNPYFVFNGDLYSNETNEYFHFRNQHLLQVEQTFSIAGKHTNSVKLARLGEKMAEHQLQDVLRSLLFEAGELYSELAAHQEKLKLYSEVLTGYEILNQATKNQLQVGAISQTEAIRLESEYLAVKTEALSIKNEREKILSEVRTLLRLSADTTLRVEQKLPVVLPELDLNVLIEVAISSRPDLLLRKTNKDFEERNLRLQKSIAVPDLKFAYQPRDRGSNYVRPYQGFNVEFSIPVFNRNQGEILASSNKVVKSGVEYLQLENQTRNEVAAAYRQYLNTLSGLKNYSPEMLYKLEDFNRNTIVNFQKRNIGLLQFIDQQRIFIQSNLQLIELRQAFLKTVNELNFAVGKTIIDY